MILTARRWTLTKYRHKLDTSSNVYTLEIHLEPVQDLRMTDDLMQIPKPAELDDWRLYQKLEVEKIKHEKGEATAIDWGIWNTTDSLEREEAKRVRTFRASVRNSTSVRNSMQKDKSNSYVGVKDERAEVGKGTVGRRTEGKQAREGRKSGDVVKRNSRPKTVEGHKKSSEMMRKTDEAPKKSTERMRKAEDGTKRSSERMRTTEEGPKKLSGIGKADGIKRADTVRRTRESQISEGGRSSDGVVTKRDGPFRTRSGIRPSDAIQKSESLGKLDDVRKSESPGRPRLSRGTRAAEITRA